MSTPTKVLTASEKLFSAADKTTQAIIRDLLNSERSVMHMKRREDIHMKLVQIVKKHVVKS